MPAKEFQLRVVSEESQEKAQEEISSLASGIIGILGGDWECMDEHHYSIKKPNRPDPRFSLSNTRWVETGQFASWMKFRALDDGKAEG